jgi:serine/threonine protein kinase
VAQLATLGRYELRRVLGQGAMGVVYEGHDPALGRRVAIKTILQTHTADFENDFSKRFIREAKAAARLNHPNIVQVYDFGVENDIAYLVMEYIQGRELRSLFEKDEQFEIGEAVRIMRELLEALDFAHEAGVIHRDVKPANVMIDAQNRVKLADFGVARIQDGTEYTHGTMVGTPAYMSPEQITGGRIDRRTDIFSAGSILYQFLTGDRPFRGGGAYTLATKIVQDDPPLPSEISATASPVFDEVVEKALAKDVSARYSTAREFADALSRGLERVVRGDVVANAESPGATALDRPPGGSRPRASDTELAFWRSIQDSADPAEFEIYL